MSISVVAATRSSSPAVADVYSPIRAVLEDFAIRIPSDEPAPSPPTATLPKV